MSLRRPRRSRNAIVVALVLAALAVGTGVRGTTAHAAGTTYHVSPTGADTDSGTTAGTPFRTIQRALNLAQPGTTILLAAGTYREAAVTMVAGTAAAPITIKGPETGKAASGRYKAVLYGVGGRVFSINHSHYTLDGFTIDGQQNIARTEYPTTLAQVRAFKDSVQSRAVNSKLIYVGAAATTLDIVGTTISNMFLNGSGGECVRFRNRAAHSVVDDSVIQWCGMLGQGIDPGQYKYHNAEGVYIGTSPKSTDQPQAANDSSNNIVVRDSTINTFGSECFEVKENAHHNRMENSDCGFNDEPLSFQGSNVELRGDHNTVLSSRLSDSRGWNLKLASDSATYDRGGNTAQRSSFSGAATYAIVNRQTGSGPFCGNTFGGTVSEGNSIGNPTARCPDTTAPTAPTGLRPTAPPPTSTPPTSTPPPTAQVVNAEAESGVLASGMTVRTDAAAQGGRYVSQPSGTGTGRVTITVNVPVAGRYALAGRVTAPNASSDSVTYAVDSGPATVWALGTRTSWSWVTGPTPTLTAGQHRIIVSRRDFGVRLDAIRLTRVA